VPLFNVFAINHDNEIVDFLGFGLEFFGNSLGFIGRRHAAFGNKLGFVHGRKLVLRLED
jgi:hypothetical protein